MRERAGGGESEKRERGSMKRGGGGGERERVSLPAYFWKQGPLPNLGRLPLIGPDVPPPMLGTHSM